MTHSVLVIDGNPEQGASAYSDAVDRLVSKLSGRGHRVTRFTLREHTFRHCSGCWSCWVRTPGRCANDDDADSVRRAWVCAGVVVFASPLVQGFLSSQLKSVVDKFIPLVHPHITLVDGECMHEHRYDRLPALALLLGDGDEADLHVTLEWARRTAEHMREPLVGSAVVGRDPMDALVEAIDQYERGPGGDEQREHPPRPEPVPLPDVADVAAPFDLLVINGSPRGRKSNTRHLLEHFQAGFERSGGTLQLAWLHNRAERKKALEAYASAEHVVFAFPLYVHAMPGVVKEFWESLPCREGLRVGFIVQSGFPEARQSRWLEQYLVRLPAHIGATGLGVAVKGGVEGIQVQPTWMTSKLFARFEALGEHFGRTGRFDPDLVRELADPEFISASRALVYRAMKVLGLSDWYWDDQLKKASALDRSFDRPYDQ